MLPMKLSPVMRKPVCGTYEKQAFVIQTYKIYLKPLSHWDATSLRWVCESIRKTVAKRSHGIAKSLHASRTRRERFVKVLNICVTKIIAKPSPSHRICREPVANLSQTFANTSQGSFRNLHNATKKYAT